MVGANAPKRSNWDCIRFPLQDHVRPQEIGRRRRRSDDDLAQCLGLRRFSNIPVGGQGLATKCARLCCSPAEFPDRWIAEGLRQPTEQTRALGGDSWRQHTCIEGAFQTANRLRRR